MAKVELCVAFPKGSLVRLTASFTNAIGDPIDPDVVSARVRTPGGVVTEHTFGDSPGDIATDGVGEYHLDVIATQAGEWWFRFESSGNGQAANEHKFTVSPSAFDQD